MTTAMHIYSFCHASFLICTSSLLKYQDRIRQHAQIKERLIKAEIVIKKVREFQ